MNRAFSARKQALNAQQGREDQTELRLRKSTSNLFRERRPGNVRRLDLTAFRHVLEVDAARLLVDVEGLTTYEDLVDATLPAHCMPQVVPELKTITIGGALSGGGIESTSFRYGFVHETVEEIEVLLGDGSTVVATPENEHRDLFYGFPNSYGTLGYALRIRARLAPVKPFVGLTHHRYAGAKAFFAALDQACAGHADFVDGVVFEREELVLTTGVFREEAPRVSNYRWLKAYYESLRQRDSDHLTIYDYLWRWDADWFWCSRVFGMQHPVLRFLFGPFMLHSRRYSQLMALDQRWRVSERWGWSANKESVIQDVQIPLAHAPEFLEFLLEEIPIRPIWICPARSPDGRTTYPLYATDPSQLYINFGFWGAMPGTPEEGRANRRIEEEVTRLNGKKSLYSSAYYSEEAFDREYNQAVYRELKARYDPGGRLGAMYDKCVRKR